MVRFGEQVNNIEAGNRIPIWRPFVFGNGNGIISAVDWSSKFAMLIDFDLLNLTICIDIPNISWIRPSAAGLWRYVDFWRWRHCFANLFPVSILVTPGFWEGRSLLAKQISTRYLNTRPKHYYFWFLKTNDRHIAILLPVWYWPLLRQRHVILRGCKFHQRRNYDVRKIFKMAAAGPSTLLD